MTTDSDATRRAGRGGAGADRRSVATVCVPQDVRRAMLEHAVREAPRECCGLLVGRERRVVAAVPTTNLEPGCTRFRVNEREHLRLQRAVRLISPRLHVIGVYHSHPDGPPRPSPRDLAEAIDPDWVYIVIGRDAAGRHRVRGFQLQEGRATRLRLREDEGAPGVASPAP